MLETVFLSKDEGGGEQVLNIQIKFIFIYSKNFVFCA